METQETGIPEAGTATYNTAFTSFRLPPNNRKRQRLLRPSPFPAEDDRAEDEAAKAECTALLEEANKMASNPRGDEDLATALSRWDAALRIMNASAAAGGVDVYTSPERAVVASIAREGKDAGERCAER